MIDAARYKWLHKSTNLREIVKTVTDDVQAVFPSLGRSLDVFEISFRKTIYHAGRFEHGWTFKIHFRAREGQDPSEVLSRFEQWGLHIASGCQYNGSVDDKGMNVVVQVYMTGSDFPTLLLWQRIEGEPAIGIIPALRQFKVKKPPKPLPDRKDEPEKAQNSK